jgi:cation diffusion facilitator family transporter
MSVKTSAFNIKVQQLIVVVSIVLFTLKVLAYFLTNSISVLTDALESIVNVVTSFTGLYSLNIAARPSDKNHPYGHGKAELVSASFEGILILVSGMFIIYEAITNLVHPHEIQQLDAGLLIIGATGAVNYLLGRFAILTGKKNHSIALIATGKHLQSDTWTTVGIVIGLTLIRITGILWIDSIAATIFGVLIIYEAYKIIRETVSGIMDEADEVLLNQLIEVLNERKNDKWIDLHNLRILKYGSVLHLDCHLTVPWYFNVNEAHLEVDALEKLVGDTFPNNLEMFVHLDGCMPPGSCRICPIHDCKVRQHPFEERLTWTFDNLTSNQKHG